MYTKGFLLLVRSPYKIERRELIGCTTCAHVIESNAENRPIIQKELLQKKNNSKKDAIQKYAIHSVDELQDTCKHLFIILNTFLCMCLYKLYYLKRIMKSLYTLSKIRFLDQVGYCDQSIQMFDIIFRTEGKEDLKLFSINKFYRFFLN